VLVTAVLVLGVLSQIGSASNASAAPPCERPSADEAMRITAECVDPRFDEPFVDIREERDTPVPHTYVHGGFTGTDAKFEFAFPPADQFDGRLFQGTHQLFFSEEIDPYDIGMAAAGGAYFVRTNMGGSEYPKLAEDALSGEFDPAIGGYRVNAAAAKYSRVIAEEIYGAGRVRGYLYGGSGGAYQTITSAEVTEGVWDGFLPFVMGTPNAIPNVFLSRVHALRLLEDKWPEIMDAFEPGGSDDPYADLSKEERAALEEATLLGFPPRAWFNYVPMGSGPLPLVAGYVPILDPSYVEDFWSKPGYLGTNKASSIGDARIRHDATVEEVIDGPQFVLSSVPTGDLTGADLVVTSGAAEGKSVALGDVNGNAVGTGVRIGTFTVPADPAVVASIQVGDELRIDNSAYLALQTYHHHQVPEPGSALDYPIYDELRKRDGSPKYPQRRPMVGPVGAFNASGEVNIGRFNAKMIVMENLLDGDAVPWQADWYRKKVQDELGSKLADSYRIWYIDNAQHTDPTTPLQETHVVSYQGVLEQGLRDLAAWVEEDVAPPPSSRYKVVDGQVEVPATARARKGIQPVVELTANDEERVDVAVGDTVTFTAEIQVPGTGEVVAADWDFLGTGSYTVAGEPEESGSGTVSVTATFTFSESGTYFPAIRVASQRDGDPDTPYARVLNLGRVRVVVE
jgi:plastocyanin